MKKTCFVLMTLISAATLYSQTDTKSSPSKIDSQEIQTIFNNLGKPGWWVSPEFSWTQFDGRNVYLAGFGGGIIINHSFSIGFTGFGITNSQSLNYSGIIDTSDVYLYGGYGGLKLEYRLIPFKMINVAFPLLIGGTGVTYSTMSMNDWNNYDHHDGSDYTYAWDSNFVIEPGVVVGINMLKFMRLDMGVSYRYAPGLDLPKTDSNLLNAFNATASLKFGKF